MSTVIDTKEPLIQQVEPFANTIETVLPPGGSICLDNAFSCYDGVNCANEDKIVGSGRYELCQQMTRKLFVAKRADGERDS
jgi:hypothetical protein